jgi:hypothetical protein
MKIVVTRRSGDDYHACLEGHPEIWGCGKSVFSVLGNLLLTHQDIFGVAIDMQAIVMDPNGPVRLPEGEGVIEF